MLLNQENECKHIWEEAVVLHNPGRVCNLCCYFEEITKKHFKQLFKRAFWRFQKEYNDRFVFGGYIKKSQRKKLHMVY